MFARAAVDNVDFGQPVLAEEILVAIVVFMLVLELMKIV